MYANAKSNNLYNSVWFHIVSYNFVWLWSVFHCFWPHERMCNLVEIHNTFECEILILGFRILYTFRAAQKIQKILHMLGCNTVEIQIPDIMIMSSIQMILNFVCNHSKIEPFWQLDCVISIPGMTDIQIPSVFDNLYYFQIKWRQGPPFFGWKFSHLFLFWKKECAVNTSVNS